MFRRTLAALVERTPRRLRLSIKAHHYAQLLRQDLVHRDWDLAATQLLVRPGTHVVDVGANVGVWTHFLSRLVGHTGRVWSFEPIPETFALLRANIERFRLGNVVLIDRAVSDADTRVSMSVPKDSRGVRNYHLARVGQTSSSFCFQISSVRLDSWFIEAGEPLVTFVKIDTEGHELACVRGMSLLLSRCLPAFCVEVSSDLDDPSSEGAQLQAILRDLKYGTYVWRDGYFESRRTDERAINYFFLRREHLPT